MGIARFSAKKKNKDNMLLLLSHRPFRGDVQHIRELFGIPPRGFAIGSAKAAEWERTRDPKKVRSFGKEIRTIIDKYNLPENYERSIVSHIIYNSDTAPLNNFDVIPFSRATDPSMPRHITVNIYARLTKEEEQDLRDEVRRLAPNLPDFKPLKDIEQKLDNEEKIRGAQEYAKRPDREYVPHAAEVLGGRTKAAQGREHLRELADHRKKRFGKK